VRGYLKQPYPGGYTNRFYAVICPLNRFSGKEK
jgi:hypothetical protein